MHPGLCHGAPTSPAGASPSSFLPTWDISTVKVRDIFPEEVLKVLTQREMRALGCQDPGSEQRDWEKTDCRAEGSAPTAKAFLKSQHPSVHSSSLGYTTRLPAHLCTG